VDSPQYYYCVGGRTALGIRPGDPARAGEAFSQERSGLHHLCFRARSREDVDAAHAFLVERGAHRAQAEAASAGYYSVCSRTAGGSASR
jgi:catechol 2,3-dioxygenase-like lactoylglutathione lyase family enzyme